MPSVLDSQPFDLSEILRELRFNATTYRLAHRDLLGLTDEQAARHFTDWGIGERRFPAYGVTIAQGQALISALVMSREARTELERGLAHSALNRVNPSSPDLAMVCDMLTPASAYLPAFVIGDSHVAFMFGWVGARPEQS